MKRKTYGKVDGRKRQVFRDEDGRFTTAPRVAKKGSTGSSKPATKPGKGKKGKGK